MGWGEKEGYDRHGRYQRVGTQNPKDCCIIGSLRRIGFHDNRLVNYIQRAVIRNRRIRFFREQRLHLQSTAR